MFRAGQLPAEQGESPTSLALRKAGYRYDRISPRMLATAGTDGGTLTVGKARYRALLITEWSVANPDELRAVARALDAGVPVIVVGAMPARARGHANAAARDAAVRATMAAVAPRLRVVPQAGIVPALTAASVTPAIAIARTDCVTVSLAHREAANGHLFSVFHEHSADCQATLALHVGGRRATIFDPATGTGEPQPGGDQVTVSLKGRRPLVVFVEGR